MTLIQGTLTTEIRKISDRSFSNFEDFPESIIEAADRWSEAVRLYSETIIPTVTPISLTLAKAAMETVLLTINVQLQNGEVKFIEGLTAFSVQIALGMQPAFTGTPPPIPIVISPAFQVGLNGGSSEDVADTLSTIIDTWFKTGLATNNSSGATIPWS